jgi:hypothetical protein
LVGDNEGEGVVLKRKAFDRLDGLGASHYREDLIIPGVVAPKVASDRIENFRLVIDGEDHGSGGSHHPNLML